MSLGGGILLLVTLLLWAAVAANCATLNTSDPAGNSLSYAYGVFMVIGLWLLLAALLVIAGVRGGMPAGGAIAMVILLPATGAATIGAMVLMSGHPDVRWPLVIPVFAPALLIGYALWAYFPGVKASVPPAAANVAVWGPLLLLSIAEAKRVENLASFEKLAPTSRLWDWMPFTWDGNELRDQALEAARHTPTRQADAEEMLGRGHPFPLVEVRFLNLEATPAFCAGAQVLLLRNAEELGKVAADLPDYDARAGEFEKYTGGIAWLKSNGCDLALALQATEQAVRAFQTTPSRELFLQALARLQK
jgi:hypothetical protein